MARCPGSCTESISNDLKWFKIDHAGLLSGNLVDGDWGNGEYLIRHELIAIHAYWTGPQFYVECAQLKVVGGGGKLPLDEYLVSFPGAYKASDPGFNVDLYSPEAPTITTYELPGPAVWTGED
ncbi:hypothetical protein H1R20_g3553, partial [Candolleomyces eurysporus]